VETISDTPMGLIFDENSKHNHQDYQTSNRSQPRCNHEPSRNMGSHSEVEHSRNDKEYLRKSKWNQTNETTQSEQRLVLYWWNGLYRQYTAILHFCSDLASRPSLALMKKFQTLQQSVLMLRAELLLQMFCSCCRSALSRHLQQPKNNPGSSDGNGGNFSVNDLIRLNLLKSVRTPPGS